MMRQLHMLDASPLARSLEIYAAAVAEHAPVATFVAYSGGRDSAVVLDIAAKHLPGVAVMAIDTGVAADGWREFVTAQAARYDVPLTFVTGAGWQWYSENVSDYGFAFTPGHHVTYYRMLKQEAIRAHMRGLKSEHTDRVLYLAGVRRDESIKRRSTPTIIRSGARVTCNVIAHWTRADVQHYHTEHLQHYDNPFYARFGNSGDCLCNWTCNVKLSQLQQHAPELYNKIKPVSDECVASGLWAYGDVPTERDLIDISTDEMPEDSLCINCIQQRRLL